MYKEKEEGTQRKLDKVKNEKSELEAQVVELKQSLATAQQDALLQVQHTDDGSLAPAKHDDALLTTPVVPSNAEENEPSDDSRMAYCLDVARKIYAVRAMIIRQI
ncbi:hypothetical protein MRX96_015804 [Rhipicephalus microplus]